MQHDIGTSFKAYGHVMRWIEHPAAYGLRLVGAAHDLVRLDHTGWYLDDWDGETAHGLVYRLSRSRGFLAAHSDAYNPGSAAAAIAIDRIYDSPEAAAYAADRIAERMAEEEREYAHAAQAGFEFSELTTDIRESSEHVRALCREIRAVQSRLIIEAPEICSTLRTAVRRELQSIQNMRKRRDTLRSEFGRENGFLQAAGA